MLDAAKQIDYSCDFLKEALFQFEVGLGRQTCKKFESFRGQNLDFQKFPQ